MIDLEADVTYQLKLFAVLKDRAGRDAWTYDSVRPLKGSQLLAVFFDEHPELAGLRSVTRLAVNQSFCTDDPLLDPGDELALIPPVSGG